MKNKIWIALISHIFIFLFLYTGLIKLIDFHDTVFTWTQSKLLRPFAQPLAIIVPIFEISIAILLFTEKTLKAGLYSTMTVMTVFTFYVVYMLLAYSKHARPCSCGGIISSLGWAKHLFLNIFLILLSFLGLYLQKRPTATLTG